LKDFGLVLFVFALGMQIGPGFFASLRRQGRVLNGYAFALVPGGALTALAGGWLCGMSPSIVGIMLSLTLLRLYFKIDVAAEAAAFQREQGVGGDPLERITLQMQNPNLDGVPISSVPGLEEAGVIVSRHRARHAPQCHRHPREPGRPHLHRPAASAAPVRRHPPDCRR